MKTKPNCLIILETIKEMLFFEKDRHGAAIKNTARRSIRKVGNGKFK